MKIVTWNINSVRLRMPLVQKAVFEIQPDILCLQETKVCDEDFPLDALRTLGFDHIVFRGQKGYHGVTILSKIPLIETQRLNLANSPDARHLSVKLPDGIELHNFYIPAGGDEPDPTTNLKFAQKLAVLDDMEYWFKKYHTSTQPIIAVGDFNIAPLEHDVWSHKQLLNDISHTPIEIEKLTRLQKTLDWVDTSRHFVDSSQKLYSWWSYRNRDWRKSNRGRRLDHIWVTPCLKPRLKAHQILTHARDWDKPSDHVPVVLELC